jgi:hypothetical protein
MAKFAAPSWQAPAYLFDGNDPTPDYDSERLDCLERCGESLIIMLSAVSRKVETFDGWLGSGGQALSHSSVRAALDELRVKYPGIAVRGHVTQPA